MGFSLRNLVKHIGDDLNPFDGPRPQRAVAPPQPASTARPQGNTLSVQPVQRQNLIRSLNTSLQPPKPLTVGVAAPQQLQVDKTIIAPTPGIRSGVAPIQPKGNFQDKVLGASAGILSSADKAAAATAHALTDVRFLTPNFVPGVSRYIDPAINKVAQASAAPFQAAQRTIDNTANQRDLYATQAGQQGKAIGNVLGAGAIYAPQIPGAVRGGIQAVKAAPQIARNIEQGVAHTTQLVQARQPLNSVGGGKPFDNAVGKAIEGATNKPVHTTKLVPQSPDAAVAAKVQTPKVAVSSKGSIASEPLTAYHGSTNDKLTSLTPGAKTGLNEKRNLVYLTEDKKTAGDYAKARGAGGLGVLKDSPTGKVYPVQVHGKVLDAYDRSGLDKLKSAPGYEQLSGKTKNHITNDTGLSADILEANPELRSFLNHNGVTAVRTHLPNGGGATQLAVINHENVKLAQPTQVAKQKETNVPKTKATQPPVSGTPLPKPVKQPTKFAKDEYAPPPTKDPAPTKTDFADENKLNTGRLNLDDEQRKILDSETIQIIDRLSNKEIEKVAKGAGMDTTTYTTQQQAEQIARELNVRKDTVRLMNEMKAATNKGDKERLILEASARGRTTTDQGSFIGRQLQARKIIANELDTPEMRVFKLLDKAGVNPEVYAKRFSDVDFNDPEAVIEAYRELVPAHATQWLDTLRYNSMLSSPLTQAVNIFGNAQNVALVAPIEKTLKGVIDATKAGLFGGERQYAVGEGGAYIGGVAKNVGAASQRFVDALRGTGQYANKDLEEYSMPLATKGIKGGTYKTLSVPTRVLDGMDKFFRALAEGGEDAALNLRESKGIRIKGNRQAIKQAESDYRVFQTELGTPGQGIVNNAFDEFAKGIMKYRNSKNPLIALPVKFTVPFVKTVNNISKQGMVDFTPLGFVNLKGNADKTTAVTRAIMGSAVFGASAALLGADKLTWAEPRNADERARFRAEGKQPYAIRLGNKWVNISKLTPSVAFPMAMTAALDDALKSKTIDQSTFDSVLEAVAKYGNFLSDQSYAKSVGDVLGAVGGDTEAIASTVANDVQQVVPFRALTGWIARLSDNNERKVDTSKSYVAQQVESLMQQYPGLRQNTSTRDYKGVPILANNPVLNGLSPVKITDDRGVDPVDAANDEAKLAKAAVADKGLDKGQKAELKKKSQKQVLDAQKALIKTDQFQSMDPVAKAKLLDKVSRQESSKASKEYKASNGIASSSGGNTITVNPKIDSHSQKVLNEYNTLSTDTKKQKAYKENDYDYKVAQAKYDNSLANGTLSVAQKLRDKDKLQKAKVGSAFSKDTRELFSISKNDLADYLEGDNQGNKKARALIAYDQALTAAGIQTKNKFKNGVISRSESAGSKASKKAANDYIASLKATQSAGNKNQSAILDLVKGAKINTAKKRLNILGVALKKQPIKKQKARV